MLDLFQHPSFGSFLGRALRRVFPPPQIKLDPEIILRFLRTGLRVTK
jgi:hypothetical protein